MGGVGQFYRASLKHINKDALPHIKYYRHVFAASIYGTPATKCEMAARVGKTCCNASANLFGAFIMPALRLIDTRCGSHNCHYVNHSVREFRRPGSRRISSTRFGPSRLRMRHIIRPQVVAPAIQSTPVAADSVATIAHLAFSLAGTILILDCAPPQRLSPALFPQLSTAPIHSSGRSRP